MFNKQLKQNIKHLDLQIGELSRELEELKGSSKYEIKMEKLKNLTEARSKLTNGLRDDHISYAVIELDRQIDNLIRELETMENEDEYTTKKQKLDDLTKVRCQLAESKVSESYVPQIITVLAGGVTTLMVLKTEKTDIITSKAWGIATKWFRG